MPNERVPSADERLKLNLWGGIECTVNRVRDAYFDQLEFSGHRERLGDLELVAELGIEVLRYPVLWETTEPRPGELDFSWCDPRIRRLRELGIEPIIGLLHHGAGPRHTSLLDPEFPSKFAKYARRIAERYPYLRFFTPINEPLTTARFSGLYGHWHPHGREDRIFVRALLNQCEGTRLAMRAIREIIPEAELVQTDDMGYTRSTEALRYQADFDNERRWLSFDLLAGRVDRHHPLYAYLLAAGASVSELGRFDASPCVPDVVGLNYYVTSERFLDDRLALYAPERIGGNGRHAYADVEAVRVCADGLIGAGTLLRDAYARYGAPVALTEAHLGGPDDERVRWLNFLWTSAAAAREAGVDVRAVTVWALFGAYGWDQLVTRGAVSYEAGVFDLSNGLPQETELTAFVRELACGSARCEDTAGWWQLPSRIVYEPHGSRAA